MKKYLYQIKGIIFLSVFLFVVETFITSTLLYLPGKMIDSYALKSVDVYKLIFIYIALFSLYLFCCYISNRLADHRRIRFEKNIKKDFFESVLKRNFKDFKSYDVGEYISMQSNDISEMCQNYLSPVVSLFRSGIMILVFGASLLFIVDPSITLIILFCSVITVFSPLITSEKLAIKNHTYLEWMGKYVTKTTSFFEAYPIFDKKSKEKLTLENEKELDEVYIKCMEFRKINTLAYVINGGSVELVSVVTFIMVAYLLFSGKITVGIATTAFMYSTKFTEPIYELNLNIGKIKSVKKIQKKLMNILDYQTTSNKKVIGTINHIELENVSKKFKMNRVILPNMKLEKGKKYMIIGANGNGKSVMLKLLMNHYEPDSGTITYDGEKVYNLDLDKTIGYLPQNAFVFNTDYINNVTLYGAYSVQNLEQYESYFPKELIEKLKKQTSLVNLSGGEKQIVAIIRCMCMEKQLLLWDEPFSAMNNDCINYFMEHINLMPQLIVIVAHNLNDYCDVFSKVYEIESEKEALKKEETA